MNGANYLNAQISDLVDEKLNSTIKRLKWLLCFLLTCGAVTAQEVEVPLLADTARLSTLVSDALGLDREGLGRLGDDQCNSLQLSGLQVSPSDQQVAVSMELDATTGAFVLGACRGPSPWQGRLALQLTPQVAESGLMIEFSPHSVELTRQDGSQSLLSTPVQLLADALVVPRMSSIQIDLSGPLTNLDGLIEQLLGPDASAADPQSLVERTHIARLEVEDAGLRAWLAFQVRARQAGAQVGAAAAPEPTLDPVEIAQWETIQDEFDGFLTTIVSVLARSTDSRDLRLELLATLLDARHAIAEALTEDNPGPDPVRELFLTTWDRLRPLLAELESLEIAGLEVDFRLAAFMAGGDALRALDALGPDYGLEITRDGLRRLARLLLEDEAPVSFTPLPLEVDEEFRALFGLTAPDDDSASTARVEWLRQVADTLQAMGGWIVPSAYADDLSPAEALRGMVPRRDNLDDYLELVARLLEEQASTWLADNQGVPERLVPRFDPLVRATAWKESCWRQLAGTSSEPQVLRSPVGAVGMMQINGRVWRTVYDLDRLSDEVAYNVNAGIEILTHYLVDYAIRRGEHEHPGGDDNLIKATYAAYNGGPSHLARYREEDTPTRLRAIDNEFWRHYTTITADQWPDISSCYAVGG